MIDFENKKLSNITLTAAIIFAVAITLGIIFLFIYSSNDTKPRTGKSYKYLSHINAKPADFNYNSLI